MKVKTYDARKEAQEGAESGGAIWKRLPREKFGAAKLTPELIGAFEKLLLEGNTRPNACRVVGLPRTTLAKWMKKGAADIEAEVDSLEAALTFTIDRAEGEQERTLSRKAFGTATRPETDGTLALKLLERRNPDEWAPALPEMGDAGAQFVGLKLDQMQKETKRVLEEFNKSQELEGEVVEPDKP